MNKDNQNNAIDGFVKTSVSITKEVLLKKLSDTDQKSTENVKEFLNSNLGSCLIAKFISIGLSLVEQDKEKEKVENLAKYYDDYATLSLVESAKEIKPKVIEASHVDM